VGVGGVNVQVRCIVIDVLGHCVLHIPANVLPLSHGVSHVTIAGSEQSGTNQLTSCFSSGWQG
jgi:hypothetical protein